MIISLPHLVAFASAIVLSFGSRPTVMPVNWEFGVNIYVASGNRETLGTDAVITFDPTILEVTKVVPGDVYPIYPKTLQDIDNTHGRLSFSATVGLNKPQIVSGTLASVYFKAKKTGLATVSFYWNQNDTVGSHIVPLTEGNDLISRQPDSLTMTFREPYFLEKIRFFFERILSFDYLQT